MPLPYTQVHVEELAADGSGRHRSVTMQTVTGHPATTDAWMTADFIHMDRFYDGDGVAIPVVISHDARSHTFRFAAQLVAPIQPGDPLVVDAWGTAEPFSVVRTGADELLYSFTHKPNGPAPTRRVEVYRLPAGATVIEAPGLAQRERDGRVELSRVATIPVGSTLSTRFRYTLPAGVTPGASLGPVVATSSPALNDPDVDPATTEIRVTFNADMADHSWSWVQSDANYPKTTGDAHYIDARTCVLPVKLKPNADYHLWINHSAYTNFRSTDGKPAVPYELTFHTGAKR